MSEALVPRRFAWPEGARRGAAPGVVRGARPWVERAQSNEDLVRRFVEACRGTRTILPATTTIERLCAAALVAAASGAAARAS